ncbi:MAG TPA: hypothetical protein VD969_06915 [Symbiobacteriaceae bacterium]|nr:hypothetical protein [Symbiobacteriaceae bacterium]
MPFLQAQLPLLHWRFDGGLLVERWCTGVENRTVRDLIMRQSPDGDAAHFGFAAESLFVHLFGVLLGGLAAKPRPGEHSYFGPDIEVKLPDGRTLLCEIKVSQLSGRIPPSRYAGFLEQVAAWNMRCRNPVWMLVTNHSLNDRMMQRLEDHHVSLFTFDLDEPYLSLRRRLEGHVKGVLEHQWPPPTERQQR